MKNEDTLRPPWYRREDETSKSYACFEIYRDIGPTRSLQQAAEQFLGRDGQSRHVEEWSRQFNWVERCRAFDEYESEQRLIKREMSREQARDVFVENAVLMAKVMVAIGTGGKSQINAAQVTALKEALDRAGVTVPKEIKVSGNPDAPLVPQALFDATVEQLAILAGVDLDRDASE